jgi:hypothetical protein
MATQTPIQRQAAAKRAAATRKRNDAKRSATATKASGRRTRGAASGAARNAQRALLIPVGALAVAGEAVRRTAETYAHSGRRARQFDRFERRGAKALDWGRHSVARRTR